MTRRAKGDGSLFKNQRGLWVGSVEIPSADGKRRQKRVASKSRNEAIRKLKKLRADVDAGRNVATSKTRVDAWLKRWIEEIHGRPDRRNALRPGTKDDYTRIIRLHINPNIGSRRLDRLTAQNVRDMQAAIGAKHPRTAQLAHVVLQRSLDDAIREGVIERNVAKVADRPDHTTKHRSPLTATQAKQLLRSTIDHDDPFATRWAAALLLGARQGELLGLQWSRLDLDRGIADFSWQLQSLSWSHGCEERHSDGTWACGKKLPQTCPQRHRDLPTGFAHQMLHESLALVPPKTKAGTRIVPIPAPLWAMLTKHPRGDVNPHDLVWHHDDGRPIYAREDYANWRAALDAAGLPASPLHVARNTTATLLLEAGVPEDIRMAILGHVSITAHRAYAHVDIGPARQAMTALDQLLT